MTWHDMTWHDIHTYIHTYTRTYIHTYIHIYIHTYIHSYIHTYMHAYMHTSQSDNMIPHSTLAALSSFNHLLPSAAWFTCYPQVCFGSVTVWHAHSPRPVSTPGQSCLVPPGWNLLLHFTGITRTTKVDRIRFNFRSSPRSAARMPVGVCDADLPAAIRLITCLFRVGYFTLVKW